MATDKSEPRTGLILRVGFLAIITLVAVRATLVAYFDRVAMAEVSRKIGQAPADSLMSVKADEKQRLTSGAMPVEKAMQQLMSQGRMSASPEIQPTPSKDVAPEQGWAKMPREAPSAMTAPAPEAASAAPADAGAAAPAPAPSAAPAAADGGAQKRPGGPGKPAAPKKKGAPPGDN